VTWIGSFRRPSVGAVSILGPDAQRRVDNNPHAIRQRRETVEHPFGTMKARMGATHFLIKRSQRLPPRWPSRSLPII
jgi:hypothetical protein